MAKDGEFDGDRRGFLRAFGIAGLGAATLATVSDEAAAGESSDEQLKSRYRLNDHVRRYYFLNSL